MLVKLWAVRRQALMICARKGWKSILCESNAKTVVLCRKKGNMQSLHWSGETLLNDVLRLCNSFNLLSFSWCNRICNSFAHLCVKWAADNNFCDLITENLLPKGIFDCIALRNTFSAGAGTAAWWLCFVPLFWFQWNSHISDKKKKNNCVCTMARKRRPDSLCRLPKHISHARCTLGVPSLSWGRLFLYTSYKFYFIIYYMFR